MGWFEQQHDQYLLNGAEPEEELEEQVCSGCEFTNCQCDAADDYWREK